MGSLVLLLFVFIGVIYMANTPNGIKIVLANQGQQNIIRSAPKAIVINKAGAVIIDGKIVDKGHLPLQDENVLNGITNRLIVIKANDSVPYKKLTDALKNISTDKNQVFLLTTPQ